MYSLRLLLYLLFIYKCHNKTIECPFVNSKNISDGIRDNATDTITFAGLSYDPHFYRTFDYVDNGPTNGRQNVAPHIRACAATVGQPIRLCCPKGRFLDLIVSDNGTTEYYECMAAMDTTQLLVRVYETEMASTIVNLFEHFIYKTGCVNLEEIEAEDLWKLYKNGSFYKENQLLDAVSYCLTGNNSEPDVARAFFCSTTDFEDDLLRPIDTKFQFLPYALLISVPFLVATIWVYAILPELRNVHGKSLICYLLGLSIGYSFLAYVQLNYNMESKALCTVFGYTIYFAFMVAFFWLNVIAFDLWWNFRGIGSARRLGERKKYFVYSVYAWGIPLAIVSLSLLLQHRAWMPSAFKANIGTQSCFFNNETKSAIIYLHTPMFFVVITNATFFALTALKIRRVQGETKRCMSTGDSRRHRNHLEQEKDNNGLFLRLFIVMGVTWSMEAISYMVDTASKWFYVTDFLNAAQGPIIFVLFVMKPKVKRLLVKRWKCLRFVMPESDVATGRSSYLQSSTNSTQKTDTLH